MKLIFISDTHNNHANIPIPNGDILIHCGDLTGLGTLPEINRFVQWWSALPHKHKVLVPGNHDFLFETNTSLACSRFAGTGTHILINDETTIDGVKIYGSPITPTFLNWAFNVDRGEPIKRYWEMIPDQVDVLVTHGPPHGILDVTHRGEKAGCEELMERVAKVKPRVHAFGHIHEGYGMVDRYGIKFINAAVSGHSGNYNRKAWEVIL